MNKSQRFAKWHCVLLASIPAVAQSLPTVDELIQKHIDAAGGRVAIERMKTRVMKGSMEISEESGTSIGFELYQSGNRWSMWLNTPGGMFRKIFDGNVEWQVEPDGTVRDIRGEELTSENREFTLYRDLRLKEFYPKMTLRGLETASGREVYAVDISEGTGRNILYFDAQTGLLARHDSSVQTPAGELQVQLSYEDYRQVDGLTVPFITRRTGSDSRTQVTRLTEILHNVSIDEAKFK